MLKARAKAVARPGERGSGIVHTAEPTILPEETKLNAEQIEAIQAGVKDSLLGGPIQGAPLEDVQVELQEVEIFEQGSTAQALRMTVAQAVRQALINAGGIKMQPIMKVEVVIPDEYVGSVQGICSVEMP